MTGHRDTRYTDPSDPVSALKETYRLIAQGKRALADAMDALEKDIRERRIGHDEATRRLDGIRELEASIQGAWRSAEALLRKMEKHVE